MAQRIDYEEVRNKVEQDFGINLTESAIALMKSSALRNGFEINTTEELIRWIKVDSKNPRGRCQSVAQSLKTVRQTKQGVWN